MSQNGLRAFLPDALLQDSLTLQERTALVVNQQGSIVACTPVGQLAAHLPLEVVSGELWAAAPVMAHAHLESFDAPSVDWPRHSFSAWVEQLLAWRFSAERLPAEVAAQFSLAELQRYGCGLVATHVAERGAEGGTGPSSLPHVIALQELFAPDARDFDPSVLDQLQSGEGLALHAPYSIADEIARVVFQQADGHLVSIHLGEHEQERTFLASGSGPLADLLAARGRPGKAHRWASPVDWLEAMGGLQAGTLVVHGGNLSPQELQRLSVAQVGMVFCPGTHQYFERPLPSFVAAGVSLPALGCDSRASNSRLDPLRELRLAFEMMPEASAQAWWHALTQRGAEVLQQNTWGSLYPGKTATVLRLSLQEQNLPQLNAEAVCDALCRGWRPSLEVSALTDAGQLLSL